jgi:hypothetical protein
MDNTKNLDPLDAVNEIFKPPIFYNSETKILNKTIINDLELLKTIHDPPLVNFDKEEKEEKLDKEDKPIYNYVFKPTNFLGEKVLDSLTTYYTTDVQFLEETQQVIDSVTNTENAKQSMSNFKIEEVVKEWKDNKSDTGFCDKYLYIGWDFVKFMNNNPQFLQLMSLYNISSPVLSLCLPIFVLIVPFFIIKARGLSLNMSEYTEILHKLVSQHAIVKIFTSFHEVDMGQKIYLIISAAFYLFSIYQNILVCIKFYSNMKKIHDYLFKMKEYVSHTIESMQNYLDKTNHLVKYEDFNNNLRIHKTTLSHLLKELELVTPFTLSIYKIFEIGHIMHLFYQLYDNKEYSDTLLYSFGFNGYTNLLTGLKGNIDGFKMNKTSFLLKDKEQNVKEQNVIEGN